MKKQKTQIEQFLEEIDAIEEKYNIVFTVRYGRLCIKNLNNGEVLYVE